MNMIYAILTRAGWEVHYNLNRPPVKVGSEKEAMALACKMRESAN